MKNDIGLVEKKDIHQFLAEQWQTDFFRTSHRNGGFIHGMVEQFAFLPRIFCDSSNDRLERAHFSSWWGVTGQRYDYTSPAIHDLYKLHEIFHTGTMPYLPTIGWESFHRKMENNELDASVVSEILVYFELPGLREATFPHRIYADRFLEDPMMQKLWATNKPLAIGTMTEARRNVMFSKPEAEMDMQEFWIRKFTMQNRQWSTVWYDRFQDIEKHMHDFQALAMNGDRHGALHFHQHWLQTEAAKDKVDNIPFRHEAELFATIYWANRKKYEAAFVAEPRRPHELIQNVAAAVTREV